MRRAICLVFAALVALAGCASAPSGSPHAMDRIIDSWQGEPIASVVRHWGEPTRRMQEGGRDIVEWETASHVHVPGASTSIVPMQSFALRCVRRLDVDARGTVTGGAWRGDLCCGASLASSCAVWPNPGRK